MNYNQDPQDAPAFLDRKDSGAMKLNQTRGNSTNSALTSQMTSPTRKHSEILDSRGQVPSFGKENDDDAVLQPKPFGKCDIAGTIILSLICIGLLAFIIWQVANWDYDADSEY